MKNSPSFPTEPTRRAAVAGTWYSADPATLTHEVDTHLDTVDTVSCADVTAVIVPHAGLVYSGSVGAYAYRAVWGRSYDVAVLVGPSHFVGFEGVSIYPRGAFTTPIGPAVVHAAIAERLLASSDLMIEYPRAHECEHSPEMQLPFLRRVLPDTPVVPLVMGVQRRATSVGLAEILARTLAGTRALLVASTDLSHYFDAERAERLDSRVVYHVNGFDWEGAFRRDGAISQTRSGAIRCMRWGTGGLGDAGRPGARRHASHGAQACRLRRCVRRQDPGRRLSGGGDVMTRLLAEHERQFLLRVARASATAIVTGGDVDVPPIRLTREGRAFVTLHISEMLRGCVGQIEGRGSLGETVRQVAAAAATEDPRFPPVRVEELQQIVIEISVLGPLEPCSGPQAIEIGRHGLVIDDGPQRELLLPQVAVERGWDAHTFVSRTCVKAGLRPDTWTRAAALSMFEADVFSEADAAASDSAGP